MSSSEELILSLRKSRKGRPTPWLDASREKFKVAAKEASAELKDSGLRGATRVMAFNRRVSEKLRASQSGQP